MAAAAKMECYCCGEPVAVNLNKSHRAYYRCGYCGLSVVSKSSDSTERMLNAAPTKNVIPTTKTTHVPIQPTHSIGNPEPMFAVALPAAARKSAFKTLMDT